MSENNQPPLLPSEWALAQENLISQGLGDPIQFVEKLDAMIKGKRKQRGVNASEHNYSIVDEFPGLEDVEIAQLEEIKDRVQRNTRKKNWLW